MADFDPPFANSAERRFPTADEVANGFPCGAADQSLFNGMFHRIESEIGEVIGYAGITQTNDRLTLLREAITALIAAATGGGTVDDYLLMSQASTRLPFFPEVLTSDGKILVTSPSTGMIRLPGGTTFQHRGISRVTTAQTDFGTDPSKTYHLRWNPEDGFTLKDLASAVYNPTTAAETNAGFDSSYDDMLVARIITNSSNVATITNLVNKDRLRHLDLYGADVTRVVHPTGVFAVPFADIPLGWSRTPAVAGMTTMTRWQVGTFQDAVQPVFRKSGSFTDGTGTVTWGVDRYSLRVGGEHHNVAQTSGSISARYSMSVTAIA